MVEKPPKKAGRTSTSRSLSRISIWSFVGLIGLLDPSWRGRHWWHSCWERLLEDDLLASFSEGFSIVTRVWKSLGHPRLVYSMYPNNGTPPNQPYPPSLRPPKLSRNSLQKLLEPPPETPPGRPPKVATQEESGWRCWELLERVSRQIRELHRGGGTVS